MMVLTKPKAERKKKPFLGALVEVLPVQQVNRQIVIETHGTVRAKEQVTLTPQISGVVNWISPSFVDGGFFRKGEALITLNPTTNANLDYTVLKAPFNGVVQAKGVDMGQYVTPGFTLGTLIGSDQVQIRSDLPLREMAWLPSQAGSPNQLQLPAAVQLTYGHRQQMWDGTVVRHLLELTPKGLMAQLLLEVEDPFHLNAPSAEEAANSIPLFIGSFVDISIPAQTLRSVFVIPAHALREQDTVWVAKEGKLEIRPVEVAYIDKDEVFISKGLNDGDQLITSPLKGAAPGLKVRIEGEAATVNKPESAPVKES